MRHLPMTLQVYLEAGSPMTIPDVLGEVWSLEAECEAALPWSLWIPLVLDRLHHDDHRMVADLDGDTGGWESLDSQDVAGLAAKIFMEVWHQCHLQHKSGKLPSFWTPEEALAITRRARHRWWGTWD